MVGRDNKKAKSCWRAILIFGLMATALNGAKADERVEVILDESKLVKLPERVSTIVVGNPLIADVSLQTGGLMVITGKSYGATNLIAMDRGGAILTEKTIGVVGARDNMVVVYRGVDRNTYSCAPECQPRITLGDAPAFFDTALAQATSRNTQAIGVGAK